MGKRPQQTLSSEDTQMANKYMKSRSTSFDIRGFQTKQQRDATTHDTRVRMAKIREQR